MMPWETQQPQSLQTEQETNGISIKRQTPDQKTLRDLAKEAERLAQKGQPISEEEAKILAKTGKTLTIDDMRKIEIEALINSGVPEDYATNAVDKAIEALHNIGITQPVKIPWN